MPRWWGWSAEAAEAEAAAGERRGSCCFCASKAFYWLSCIYSYCLFRRRRRHGRYVSYRHYQVAQRSGRPGQDDESVPSYTWLYTFIYLYISIFHPAMNGDWSSAVCFRFAKCFCGFTSPRTAFDHNIIQIALWSAVFCSCICHLVLFQNNTMFCINIFVCWFIASRTHGIVVASRWIRKIARCFLVRRRTEFINP